MIGKSRWKEKVYRITYDKPGLNRRAFALKKSLEEVKRVLQGKDERRKK